MSAQLIFFIAILRLLSPRRLFKYFKWRYTRDQTECLNNVLRNRFVCRCIAFNVAFLKQCLEFGICPGAIQKRVQRAKAYQSLSIERDFHHGMTLRDPWIQLTKHELRLNTSSARRGTSCHNMTFFVSPCLSRRMMIGYILE